MYYIYRYEFYIISYLYQFNEWNIWKQIQVPLKYSFADGE